MENYYDIAQRYRYRRWEIEWSTYGSSSQQKISQNVRNFLPKKSPTSTGATMITDRSSMKLDTGNYLRLRVIIVVLKVINFA